MQTPTTPSFNLVDEPWIQCVSHHGGPPSQVSLRDALSRAHELREITDDSPLVVVALHRLLLAIVHRVYAGPATVENWRVMRERGAFDASRIGAYLDQWRFRFDLFDPHHPFYQIPHLPDADTKSIANIAHEKASGNNITLFDHTTSDSGVMTPAQAARYLMAFQVYAIGGGVARPFNFSDAPLARDYTVLVRGASLFETLMLNLVRYDRERPIAWLGADDAPWWEQTVERTPVKEGTPPNGYLDYLTWQGRRVHLMYDSGSGLIRECQILQNLKLAMDAHDPFKAYAESKDKGVFSRRLSAERAVWRDSHALLEAAHDGGSYRPAIFDWIAECLATQIGRRRGQAPQCDFDVLGFLNDGAQATVILWRHDHLPLPLSYLTSNELRNHLRQGLRHAEEVAELFKATFTKGRDPNSKAYPRPLYRLAEELVRGGGLNGVTTAREVKPEVVRQAAKRFDAERMFWAALEPRFRYFMVDLARRMAGDAPDMPEASGARDAGADALLDWSQQVETCARTAFQSVLAGLEMTSRTVRARALAERDFDWQLRAMLNEFRQPWVAREPVAQRAQ